MLNSVINHDIGHGNDKEEILILSSDVLRQDPWLKGDIGFSLSTKERADEHFGDELISISNDGEILAYGLSKKGSIWTTIHFLNITRKQKYETDILRDVRQDTFLAWIENGLFYTVSPASFSEIYVCCEHQITFYCIR